MYGSGSMSDIVWFVRLPRLVLAIGVGMALALAGVVMQAIVKTRWPIPMSWASPPAPPWATLAILVGVGSFLGSGYVGLVAFAGAFLVSMGVIALANIGGRATSVKLILAGTALSAICAAVSNFFLYVINTSSGALEAVVRWTMGSLAAASWDTNLWMLAVAVLGALFFWTQYRTLNLMLLGTRPPSPWEPIFTAGGLSISWRRPCWWALLSIRRASSALWGWLFPMWYAFSLERTTKADSHQRPAGAIFLLWSDVLCRVVLPGKEIPIEC